MTGFGIDPLVYLTGPEEERAVSCFVSYMTECTGAWFSHLTGSDPDCISAADLVAVTTLSVEVPPGVTIWIDQHGEQIEGLLSHVPMGPIMEVAEESLADGSPASQLWELLQARRWPEGSVMSNRLGPVTAGKLLAAKRPALIPIWDQWVQVGLRPPTGGFWVEMWRRFQDAGFVEQLRVVREAGLEACRRSGVAVPTEPTDLRTLDIVVWMRTYGHARRSDPAVRALAATDLGSP